jgi:glucose/arabinose dehydrogenase
VKLRIFLVCALLLAGLLPAVPAIGQAPTLGHEVGLFDPDHGRWYLRHADGRVVSFYFGNPEDLPLFGDWDCDGIDTVGVYRPRTGEVLLRNSNDFGFADEQFYFGRRGDLPFAGDWDGDCYDTVGIFRRGHVFLTNTLETGPAEVDFWFGVRGDQPFAGDFNASGSDGIGLLRAGASPTTFLAYEIPAGTEAAVDEVLPFFGAGRIMFAGDWNGNESDTLGQFRSSTADFLLVDVNDRPQADYVFGLGERGWLPVAGELGPPPPLPSFSLDTVVSGLALPVFLTAPEGDDRLFVVEQHGLIKIVENGVVAAEPFLDLRGQVSTGFEQGILGLEFHPSYATNAKFYVHYTDTAWDSRVVEYQRWSDIGLAGPDTIRELVFIDQPYDHHNGGMIQFGPDGRLYIGFGDGGRPGDPGGNGQNSATRLASIVAIDVDTRAYEIWAIGLRNPWRFDIDGDRIFIGDVGEGSREEVSLGSMSVSGQNFGWVIQEGSACFPAGTLECDTTGLIQPIAEYSHGLGCAITGGFVYRGSAIPDLQGAFLYSDFCTGFLRGFLEVNGEVVVEGNWTPELGELGNVLSFGEDGFGELYILTLDGRVRKIVPAV